jgi:hypothetical protein
VVSVDDHFAPGVENITVTYNISQLSSERVVIRVSSATYPNNPVFERELTSAEKSDGNNKTLTWNGQATASAGPLAGTFIDPAFSPYRIELASPSLTDGRPFNVIIDSIQLTTSDTGGRYIMNTPATQTFDVFATVTIRNIANIGVVTPCPIKVVFTFADPAPANATPAGSFTPTSGVPLGKQGSTTAIFWRADPGWPATSDNAFNANAKVDVLTAAGVNRGKSKILFLPGGCGGDDYTIRAEVFAADGTTSLATRTSPILTVFRSVRFTAYEMTGQTAVTTHGTEAVMAGFYTGATFVEYHLGTITRIPAQFSVQYIGLWDHATLAIGSWATIQAKITAETPTATETTDANGPAGPVQVSARAAIQTKANAWRDRIIAAYNVSLASWPTDAAIPANVVVAADLEHPKYSAQAPAADSTTSEWTAFPWLRITVEGRAIHPDQRWINGQGVTLGSRAFIMSGMSAARIRVAIAHEAGHASKTQFPRDNFGPGDHSAAAGLMDTVGSQSAFTAAEIKILRGIL